MFFPETPGAVEIARSPAFPEMRSIRAVPAEQNSPTAARSTTTVFFMGTSPSVVRFGGKSDRIYIKDLGHCRVGGVFVELNDMIAVFARGG